MEDLVKKYEPKILKDFTIQKKNVELLDMLMAINLLNVLIIGGHNSGKTSIAKTIMKNYDKENIMVINTLTDQGISYCRNDLKIFCKSTNLKHIR